MTRTACALLLAFLLVPLAEARADLPRLGIFRKKKEDPPASDKDKSAKAKQLFETLKNDPDEKKRLAAIDELSSYDPRTNLDLLPALLTSLKSDPSPDVRAETAELIGSLKPVVQNAGVALEQTLAQDPSESVRKATQQALWQYHLNGYRSAGTNPSQPQTAEPPLAKPKSVPIAAPAKTVQATPVSTIKTHTGGIYQQTAEPPLAKPRDAVKPPTPNLAVPPLPQVPTVPPPATTPSIPPPNR